MLAIGLLVAQALPSTGRSVTYYPDLSKYDYWRSTWPPSEPDGSTGWLNVGWLGKCHPFEKGSSPDGFLGMLVELAGHPERLTRGVHQCEFCERKSPIKAITPSGAIVWLGNGEISVDGPNETKFVCPTLIAHYVADHSYLPPRQFIRAVMISRAREIF